MEALDATRAKIRDDQFEFSQYAVDQSMLRRISVQDVCEAIEESELIRETH